MCGIIPSAKALKILKYNRRTTMVEKIIEIIADYQEKDVEEYTPDQTFMEMGLDSLDLAELVLQLEDAVEAEIDLTPAYNTPAKLAAYIETLK
jgi:acyl carrier protein